ncbi:aminotransferase class I/II-fold pyridoxal phosphate-dependent enzyme [Beijerinckia sp. L45]|uniref:aminotransferase class I/II-fold pyridoxal phosphate-dependent enzyme n=1 Tax=Beijerinckia sp. L45 TaxID=1641855 RepID=UPI00131E1DBA|nr:aminotransferase class I/II-fold pyridoxal phosphate-dependent enzyme [Beijerinckia sp. L45]
MQSLDRFATAKLDALDKAALRRRLVATARDAFPWVIRDGRRLLSFSCNDYLGLSTHPAVKAAAIAATERYGVGAGASRLVTGNHPLYEALETRLASLKGTEAACVFGSGYLANIGVIGALVGLDDLILLDDLAHACLHAGARLSQARVMTFRHNDVTHAAALLEAHRGASRHVLVVTETVFSMDGDRAPIADLAALAQAHDAWLLSDDAHGFGVMPHDPAIAQVPLQMGTLSKAVGGYGGYLCASQPVIDLIKTRARSLIYSTGLPPASVAAALAALDVIAADPGLAGEPLRKARLFTAALGLPEAESPIVPLLLGPPEAALRASAVLAAEGFLVTAIRPPTVPPGTARLRFAFSAAHADSDIARLAEVITVRLADLFGAAAHRVAS